MQVIGGVAGLCASVSGGVVLPREVLGTVGPGMQTEMTVYKYTALVWAYHAKGE